MNISLLYSCVLICLIGGYFHSSLCELPRPRLGLSSSLLTRLPHGDIHQADTHPCVGVLPAGLIDCCPLWAASLQKIPSGGWTASLVPNELTLTRPCPA